MFRKPKKKFHALKEKLKMREGYVKILNDNDVKLEFSDSFYYFNDSGIICFIIIIYQLCYKNVNPIHLLTINVRCKE